MARDEARKAVEWIDGMAYHDSQTEDTRAARRAGIVSGLLIAGRYPELGQALFKAMSSDPYLSDFIFPTLDEIVRRKPFELVLEEQS